MKELEETAMNSNFLQREKKGLIFEEIQNLSVIDINSELKDKIEIKYADKLVNNFFVLIANIKNNGILSIKKNEIIAPIKITFKEKLLECVVTGVNSPGIEVDLKINKDENSVECSFNLLNPLDYITLQFVSLEKLSTPTIASRIDGLSNVNITSISDRGSLHWVKYDKDNYSNEYPFTHRLKVTFQYLKYMWYRQPLFFLSVTGLIMASIGILMGLKFVQDFLMGDYLRFGPTLLMVMLTIIGLFMVLTGVILYLLSNTVYDLTRS